MNITASRRGFLRGIAGAAAIGASGCFSIGRGRNGKIRLAAVGVMGKGYSDWTPMLKTGLAEMVAFCDIVLERAEKAAKEAKIELEIIEENEYVCVLVGGLTRVLKYILPYLFLR